MGKNLVNGATLIGQITEYIRINIRNPLTISHIAENFGYDPDYICKLFKKHFSTGLKTYFSNMKLNLSKDMLLTTNMSAKEIAYSLGFEQLLESPNLFAKFFIYHEGISPIQFRNRYYNSHINNR